MKEIVQDRYGNTIYLTDERWNHIVERHSEFKDHKGEVVGAIRSGKRKQDSLHPDIFYYVRAIRHIPSEHTHIKVVVAFRMTSERPNNFVVTAFPISE